MANPLNVDEAHSESMGADACKAPLPRGFASIRLAEMRSTLALTLALLPAAAFALLADGARLGAAVAHTRLSRVSMQQSTQQLAGAAKVTSMRAGMRTPRCVMMGNGVCMWRVSMLVMLHPAEGTALCHACNLRCH